MSLVSEFPMQERRRAPRLGRAMVQAWQGLFKSLRDPYRPERHYMRGPGPKWHAKHGVSASGRSR